MPQRLELDRDVALPIAVEGLGGELLLGQPHDLLVVDRAPLRGLGGRPRDVARAPAEDDLRGRAQDLAEVRGQRLTVIGLAPWGSRAFTLVQEGREVTFTKELDEELPFPPEAILQDLHRTWFKGWTGAARPDGAHTSQAPDGETITERWEGGRLHERRFARPDAPGRNGPAAQIVVTYGEGLSDLTAPPRRAVLDNGWFGYRLEVETLEAHRLE